MEVTFGQSPLHREALEDFGVSRAHRGDAQSEESFPASPPHGGSLRQTGMSQSMQSFRSHGDMRSDPKAMTAEMSSFSGATSNGVLKRTTYLTSISSFRSTPKFSFGQKGNTIPLGSNPAPGTYELPPENRSKFKMEPRFSFGGNGSRFGGLRPPNMDMPGPGAYMPQDPLLKTDTKVGFGTAARGRDYLIAQAGPGPGAYDRKQFGGGLMFSAAGDESRHTRVRGPCRGRARTIRRGMW